MHITKISPKVNVKA